MIHGGIVSLTSWTWNPWINERRKEKREGMYTWLILCLYTLIKRLKINWIFSLISTPPPPTSSRLHEYLKKNSVSAPDQTYKCNYIWLVTITYTGLTYNIWNLNAQIYIHPKLWIRHLYYTWRSMTLHLSRKGHRWGFWPPKACLFVYLAKSLQKLHAFTIRHTLSDENIRICNLIINKTFVKFFGIKSAVACSVLRDTFLILVVYFL